MDVDNMRILLVEDNPGDARLLEWYLSKPGSGAFQVRRAERLSDALRELAATRFDLVLLDLSLPDSSGLDTVRAARAAAGMTPIVVLTGLDDEETALTTLRDGAQDYLIKGKFDNRGLIRSLHYAIERERAEQTLRQTKEALEAIIAASPAAVLSLDAEGRVVTWNESAEHIFGWTAAEAVGRIPRFIPAGGEAEFDALLKRVIAGAAISDLEVKRRRKDGALIDVSLSASRICGADGVASGVVAVLADVTERKRAEAELRESEGRFRELFDSMSSGVAVYETRDQGASFIFKDISQGGERIDSLRREEVVGRNVEQIFPSIKKFGLLAVLRRVWQTGKPERHPVGHYEDDRISGWRENHVYRIPSGEVVAVYDDVTARMQAEAAMRESEERFRGMFDAARDGMVLAEAETGRFVTTNGAFCKMVGYDPEEVLRLSVPDIHPSDSLVHVKESFDSLVAGKISLAPDILVKRRDGSVFYADVSAAAISIGGRSFLMGVFHDITERKQSEEALRTVQQRREQLENIVSRSPAVAFLWRTDEHLTVDFVSSNVSQLGYEAEEFLSGRLHYADVIHPEDRDRAIAEAAQYIAAGTSEFVQEYRILTKTGEQRWVEDHTWVPHDSDGAITHHQGIIVDITERRAVEAKLRESELKFRAIFDSASEGMFLIEQESRRFVLADSSCLRMLGYSADEFAKLQIADLHPEEDLPFIFEQIGSFMKGEAGRRGDIRYKRKDGSLFPADSSPARVMLGDKACILIMFRDITERKQAEEALVFSNVILRTQQETSIDGILVVDEKGGIISFNQRFVDMWGIPLDVIESRSDERALQSVMDRLAIPEEFARKVQHLYEVHDEVSRDEILLKDGATFDRYSAPMLGAGEKYYGRVWYFRDITKRKQAEAALAESELTYRRLFESSNDAMMLLDSGQFLDCNEAALRMLGYSTRDEFLGKHPGEVSPPLQADGRESRIAADENITTAFRDGRNFFEWLHQRADGTVFAADVLLTPLDYHGRKVLQATVRDITPRKLAEAEIARKNVELAQLNTLKNQFLGMAAHDLRNPLSVVSAASSFLLDDAGKALPEAKKTDFLRRIKNNGEFMLKLIDDLLDVAKIESGRLDLEPVTGDLCGLIEENLTMNRMLAEKKSIRLDFAPECGLPLFRFDPGKVEQVLNNLISNAVKFSATGTAVTVKASRVDGTVVVSVRDHGQGIPAEELDKLFKPFSKTSVRGTDGEKSTGLGLAICRKIVEGHHGRIWAESEVGKGSVFSFSLPVATDDKL